jgi:hypothetical protein
MYFAYLSCEDLKNTVLNCTSIEVKQFIKQLFSVHISNIAPCINLSLVLI